MITIAAPAKINLFLHITGKYPNGYHVLESLVAFTEFGDTLEITPAEKLTLSITGPGAAALPVSNDNLILKAARLLQQNTGCKSGANITLHKHIPVGAGLGGGSSDAAAALKGLMQLWNISLPADALQTLALQLGSDVPVCLQAQAAYIEGTGEKITPVSLFKNFALVLVSPNIPLLTADVYRRFAGTFSAPAAMPKNIDSLEELLEITKSQHNALEAPAIALLPIINDVLAALRATPGCRLARMSGSGSASFAIYASEQEAKHAAELVKHAHPSWWCVASQPR